jgi:aryl-alcohol dehydrogenase-like predicted oxidoreductase
MTLNHSSDLGGCYDPAIMEMRAHTVLDAAYAAGVRYVDVARSYGRAEDFVASWLAKRGLQPGDMRVGSKWGYTYIGRWSPSAVVHELKDHSIVTLRRQLAESIDRLGSHLSLYQIHSVTADGTVLRDGVVIDTLAGLRERGISTGLTVSGAQQDTVIRQALEIYRDGERVFDSVQATWNLFEQSAETALSEAHASGMKVIVKEALANGRLARGAVEHLFSSRIARLEQVATNLDTTIDALALAAALALPWADVVLTGAATVQQLQSNLCALSVPWDHARNEQLRSFAMPPREYWGARSTFKWN